MKRLRELNNEMEQKYDTYDADSDSEEEDDDVKDQFQVQFNYINVEEIQGDDKISISRTLKEAEDLALFE